jgi:hypothetical protein
VPQFPKKPAAWIERRLEAQRRIGPHLNPRQFMLWFLGLALPFTLAMSAFIGWHNSVVNPVQPRHLLLRAAIGMAGYLAIIVVVCFNVFRPAMRKAKQESECSMPAKSK